MATKYNHSTIEKKWQEEWERQKLYEADINKPENKFYNLFMFPYPSAEGLHAGHAFSSTGSDVYGRFVRMNGSNVFQPMGYDSFGIHSENYALKIGEYPGTMLVRTIKHYEDQFRSLGHGYDWAHSVTTSDISFYHWTEWLFIQLFEAGLAYRKKAEVNFCPKDKTVLADEQVMTPKQAGKEPVDAEGNPVAMSEDLRVCERCGTVVEKRELEQWFLRITDYADKLLDNLGKIDWSEKVKIAQKEWIGKSRGMIINFKKDDATVVPVFTTRPDTLNAVTFIATSDDKLYNRGEAEKVGIDTGHTAEDPLSGRKIPIWKTNYIAPGYGTGAVMGVPAHDERDMEFARKYHLDIVQKDPDEKLWKTIEEKGWGKLHTNYHLRDWLISRQRYWGTPIPMIYCDKCAKEGRGWIASNNNKLIHVSHEDWQWQGWWPDENLPVELPVIKDWKPEGTGKGPLANHPDYYKVKCPNCGSEATRETDVADTFLDSSWYFLRYPSVGSKTEKTKPFDSEITKTWLPVDLYFGGAEHSVLHLMYARFVTMVLKDLKYLNFDEPFPRFFAHGLMIKDGAKMSKSRGNVVNPDEYIKKFGADAFRLYVMFIGPMDSSPDFRDTGIEGMERFINRLWHLFGKTPKITDKARIYSKMHQTIKKVTDDISKFKYNTAIASLMEFLNVIQEGGADRTVLKNLCLMLAPFAPHLAEEIWVEVLGQPFSVHKSVWPKYDANLIKVDQVKIIIQINAKVRGTVGVESSVSTDEVRVTALAKEDDNIAKWLVDKKIKKTIFISGKLLNFVV